MEFESFEADIRRLLKDHRDYTKKLDIIKKKAEEGDLEPFYSKTKE